MSMIKVARPFLVHAAAYEILTHSDLRTLVLWCFRSSVDEQRIVERVIQKRAPDGPLHYKLAVIALADRRYDQAVRHFDAARSAMPKALTVPYDQLFAMCLAGRSKEASRIAPRIIPAGANDQTWWRFAEGAFDIRPPDSAGTASSPEGPEPPIRKSPE
jgi:hypothetical protein